MIRLSNAFLVASLAVTISLGAQEKSAHGELIFKDDFDRNESQEETDEPGNGWKTNSKSRAQGDKQVDLKDGAMRIYISPKADHGVSVTHEAEFKNGAVGMKFLLEEPKDALGLNFADLKFKEVHAGHLFAVRITANEMKLQDLKTGAMNLETRTARQNKSLTDEQKKMLKGKEKKIKNKLELGKWHDLFVNVKGETLSVSINGEEVGSFTSEGIAHPTKRTLRLAVPTKTVVDEVRIWKAK